MFESGKVDDEALESSCMHHNVLIGDRPCKGWYIALIDDWPTVTRLSLHVPDNTPENTL
jgi:hypothetical protein